MASRLAIYHPQGGVAFGDKPFGKDVANRDLFAALLRHGGYERIDVFGNGNIDPAAFTRQLMGDETPATRIESGYIMRQQAILEAGVLLRGKADIANLAWLRRRAAGDRAYSLVGLIHTLAPPAVRDYIAGAATAPVQPWDALICTSPSVRDAMIQMFDDWGGFLADRFGGSRRPRPALPLVPLGVDGPAIARAADDAAARAETRAEFGLSDDDVMLLWVGRLSFFEKAFPQPMFRAAQGAAAETGKRLVFVHAGWFPHGEHDRERYEAAVRAYAPDVEAHFVGGEDRGRIGRLWAAGDVFVSLVDNIQETFGITPVEAMAAGLPVVVSDWDGYRYTVQDGVEGLLIPTLGAPAGRFGYAMVSRHVLGMDSYQTYAGTVAQYTAVHVGKAAEALSALVRSPDLRRRMGEAGRRRVAAMFDWPAVVATLQTALAELADIRIQSPAVGGRGWIFNPAKGDPFHDFAGFPTGVVAGSTPLRFATGASAADLERAKGLALDQFGAGWRASLAECAEVLDLIERGEATTVAEVLQRFPQPRGWSIEFGLMWMMKLGILDWLPGA